MSAISRRQYRHPGVCAISLSRSLDPISIDPGTGGILPPASASTTSGRDARCFECGLQLLVGGVTRREQLVCGGVGRHGRRCINYSGCRRSSVSDSGVTGHCNQGQRKHGQQLLQVAIRVIIIPHSGFCGKEEGRDGLAIQTGICLVGSLQAHRVFRTRLSNDVVTWTHVNSPFGAIRRRGGAAAAPPEWQQNGDIQAVLC